MYLSVSAFTLFFVSSCYIVSFGNASGAKESFDTEYARWRRVQCGVPSELSEEQKLEMLNAHNEVRRQEGADILRMSWDDNLAARAQEWANHCNFSHAMKTDCDGNSVGQNGGMNFDQRDYPAVDVASVVHRWAAEREYWNFTTNLCQPEKKCGHWTQVVWSSSSLVGCGLAKCPPETDPQGFYRVMVFCDYSPVGNYYGVAPFTPGDSCTACHKVTRKSDTDRGFKCVDQLCVVCSPLADTECQCGPADQCNIGLWNGETCRCDCPVGFYGDYCEKQCYDIKPTSSCEQWKALDYCNTPELQWFMEKNCAKTCGVCTTEGESTICVDINPAEHCEDWKSQDFCILPEYEEFMQDNCAKTCGFCQ